MTTSVSLMASAVVGAFVAWIAGRFMTGNGLGLLRGIALGVVAAIAAPYALRIAGIDPGGLAGGLLVSFIAAASVLFLVHELSGRRRGHRMWS